MLKRVLISVIVALLITTVIAVLFTAIFSFTAEYDFRAVGAIIFMMVFTAAFLLLKPSAMPDEDDTFDARDDEEASHLHHHQ
jgi:hypothetical protein